MPSFTDAVTDAHKTQEAVRALADATQDIRDADVICQVLESLPATLRSLRQTLDQLVAWHNENASRAMTKDGDRNAGQEAAYWASDHLRFAAALSARAGEHVRRARNRHGSVAWAADPTAPRPLFAPADVGAAAPAHRSGLNR